MLNLWPFAHFAGRPTEASQTPIRGIPTLSLRRNTQRDRVSLAKTKNVCEVNNIQRDRVTCDVDNISGLGQ